LLDRLIHEIFYTGHAYTQKAAQTITSNFNFLDLQKLVLYSIELRLQ